MPERHIMGWQILPPYSGKKPPILDPSNFFLKKSWIYFLAMRPWASYLNFMSLSFISVNGNKIMCQSMLLAPIQCPRNP